MPTQQYLPTDLPEEIPSHATHGHSHQSSKKTPDPTALRTLLSWHAPGRPFRKRGREFYMGMLLLMLLVEIILFLFGEYMGMLVVLSLVFVTFALVTIPPHDFHYKISTEGIMIEDHFYLWQELYDFYFKRRDGVDVLHIRTEALFPGELTLTLGSMDRHHVQEILIRYLPYREIVQKTFMEKSGDWLAKTFPLEKPQQES